ncbi:hypothetical protein SERLADRAFT_377262 [Serpula lacrymans var. lacrymans S7.9]|uniref:NAD(P)-binding protein n=1 Tax=Serpula lacrymans var. lacrymans (strain S7.9) TaxID=578457 RepID=F8NI60_SERL9|nr:uncharacterized protein SERLADRAFT_377262 [Serpula lacrymans var. lacrymans S7.9]EGO28957.1 hypothetical protein SERLADRAFT_377262 [Serpula lacrymans var. lacrymans S7.9]
MPSISDSKCILIIGATSGLGRSLALSILALPSKPTVIVSGRRQGRLDELAQAHADEPRLKTLNFDVGVDRVSLKASVNKVISQYPELDAVMFSAGIQHQFDFTKPESIDLDQASDELNTNYNAIFNMITFFLPHLIQLGKSRPTFIYTVTSGLAIVPGPWVPNYCATKAALHSLSLSLNVQLRDSNVHVVEIIPPLVESELHDHQLGANERLSRFWMPLEEFTALTMERLEKGDIQVPIGPMVGGNYKEFEEGKVDQVIQMFKRM